MSKLKRALFDKYGGFSDKRIKKLEKGSHFIVDTRKEGGEASDGLFGWFCAVGTTVVSDSEVVVELGGDVPVSDPVKEWLAQHGLKVQTFMAQTSVAISIKMGEQGKLTELANLISDIVKPGARYGVASYKYNCPRTAQSLRELQAVLNSVWIVEQSAVTDGASDSANQAVFNSAEPDKE